MKKMILIFLLGVFFYPAFSQYNTELIDETKMWSSLAYTCWGPSWTYKSCYHKFSGDTVINQINYKRVWESEDEDHLYWTHIGYIRENDSGEIFYRNVAGNEGLLYKFNVDLYDTLVITNSYMNVNFIVTVRVEEIDSVFLSSINQNIRRIKLEVLDSPGYYEEYWLDGIGSSAGLLLSGFHAQPLTGAMYSSLCHWMDNTLVYSNPNFSYCFNTTVTTNELNEKEATMSVYPVPLTSQSFISLNSEDIQKGILEIRDVFGHLVYKGFICKDDLILIERRQFKSGIYIITLFDGQKLITRKKLLVI